MILLEYGDLAHLAKAGSFWNRATKGLTRRITVLYLTAVLAAFASVLTPDLRLAVLLAGCGLTLGLIATTLKLRGTHKDDRGTLSIDGLIAFDEHAVFVTDATGHILAQNLAARDLAPISNGEAIDQAVGQFLSNASAIVFRLQAKAYKVDTAFEDVVTRHGRFRLAVHRIADTEDLIWRVHYPVEQSASGHPADRLSLPMFTIGGSGAVLFMNDAMRKLVGARAKSLDDLFVDQPTVSGQNTVLNGVDGPIDALAIILPSNLGRTEYFMAPTSDAEAATTSAAMTRLEDFPVALIELEIDGRLKDYNGLARNLLGLDKCPAETLSDLIEGLGRPVADWLSEASEGKGLHRPEVLKSRRGPDEVYIQVTLGRAIQNGEISLIALINDATELKSLEAQFVQSQKMQAIGQLAGGVAHDFNNLLTAISGHCDLLMLRHDAGDQDYADLEQINQNANRAASLVGQLLAFSRKQNLQLEILDMRDTLSDLTHLLNRLVGAQISLTLSHDPNLMSVKADRRQLEQVLMNLVVNARDALGGNGEIVIETRNINLTSELKRDRAVVPAGDYVLVKVSDDGCGIPIDKLPKIFEPFYTTKKTGDGTGLGLSTAYGIIKQSGGFIFADSDLGQGTVFSIYFPTHDRPVAKTLATEEVLSPAIEPGLAGGIVLLVEDEAPVRAFASRALQHRGFQVIEADCAEAALSMLDDKELDVDVILTDVIMPGMDGPTWVKLARQDRPDLRVVFMSGYADGNTIDEQSSVPNSVFLPKPFSLDELTTTVRRHVNAA